MPRRSLPLRHPPRRPSHQQWLRASPPPQRRLPQGHRLLQIPLGSAPLRRRRFRHRDRPPPSKISPPSNPRRTRRSPRILVSVTALSPGVSSYCFVGSVWQLFEKLFENKLSLRDYW